VDGNNVEEVYVAGRRAVDHARNGHGPAFLECRTYRWRGHVGPAWEFNLTIRTREEVEEWMARCPIKALQTKLLTAGLVVETDLQRIVDEENAQIQDAVQFARESPYPSESSLLDHVYAARAAESFGEDAR
jgi:pyruvate dehydrogenase E1 component alpha subunit